MTRFWFGVGTINAFVSVAAGAFGAHALRQRLSPEMLAVFETGARYQMYHALGLCAVSFAVSQNHPANPAGWAMLAGIVLFSGSLYALALTGIRGVGVITPLGGMCFLAAWALLFWALINASQT